MRKTLKTIYLDESQDAALTTLRNDTGVSASEWVRLSVDLLMRVSQRQEAKVDGRVNYDRLRSLLLNRRAEVRN